MKQYEPLQAHEDELDWDYELASSCSLSRSSSCCSLILEPVMDPRLVALTSFSQETPQRQSLSRLREEKSCELHALHRSVVFRTLEIAAECKVKAFLIGNVLFQIVRRSKSCVQVAVKRIQQGLCNQLVRRPWAFVYKRIGGLLVLQNRNDPSMFVADLSGFYYQKMHLMEFQVAQMKDELQLMMQAMQHLEQKLIVVQDENQTLLHKLGQLTLEQAQQSLCESPTASETTSQLICKRHCEVSSSLTSTASTVTLVQEADIANGPPLVELNDTLSQERLRRLEIPRSPGRTPLREVKKSHSTLSESILKALDDKFQYLRSPPESPSTTHDSFLESPRFLRLCEPNNQMEDVDFDEKGVAEKQAEPQDPIGRTCDSNQEEPDQDFLAMALRRAKQKLHPVVIREEEETEES